MNLADFDIFTAQVRALQAIYPQAHAALVNWGRWSRDRAGIFPPDIKPPSIWEKADPSKFGDFAEDGEQGLGVVEQAETKAERIEAEPYDEKAGTILDERIHAPGGLSCEIRRAIRVAYVSRETMESQFPDYCGTTQDGYRERLETALLFVSRFV